MSEAEKLFLLTKCALLEQQVRLAHNKSNPNGDMTDEEFIHRGETLSQSIMIMQDIFINMIKEKEDEKKWEV